MRRRFLGIACVVVLAAQTGCGEADASASAVPDRNVPPNFPLHGPEGVAKGALVQRFVDLTVGDSAYEVRAIVERNNGRVDTLALPVTRVQDSSVVRVVDGRLLAVDAGQTTAEITLNAMVRLAGVINVEERVFADSVWLAPGQVRAWELRPGWHRITVDAKAPPGEPQPLSLAADLVCVPDARGPKESIICRVRQNTRVLLKHTGVGTQTGPALAVVQITRLPR